MCSKELIKYCKKNNIQQPFTKKSLKIKKQLQKIVSEITTPDMNEHDKIRELTRYVVANYDYNFDLVNSNSKAKKHSLIPTKSKKQSWSEAIDSTLNEKSAICYGLTQLTQMLFREAGIKCYTQEKKGHMFNLVFTDNHFSEIDITDLLHMKVAGIDPNKYAFNENSRGYMIPHNSEKIIPTNNFLSPKGAYFNKETENSKNEITESIEINSNRQEPSSPWDIKNYTQNYTSTNKKIPFKSNDELER